MVTVAYYIVWSQSRWKGRRGRLRPRGPQSGVPHTLYNKKLCWFILTHFAFRGCKINKSTVLSESFKTIINAIAPIAISLHTHAHVQIDSLGPSTCYHCYCMRCIVINSIDFVMVLYECQRVFILTCRAWTSLLVWCCSWYMMRKRCSG